MTTAISARRGRLGESAARPDGIPKVRGQFAFSSDLFAEGMLWGHILRSPHPAATIRSIDVSLAMRIPGVRAVLVADDVPGRKTYGLDYPDQPVFASDVVRYVGEPVAAVAADHPETARRVAAAIIVDYAPTEPLIDPVAAIDAEPIHPLGNVLYRQIVRHGDPDATGAVVVEGHYQTGMQDQAQLGPESGLAIPAEDGGIDLYVATQWLHVDQDQMAACLALPLEKVRVHLAGVGGAFGAREDLSMQIQISLLALRTGRPVKIVYDREESFLGHVHRHPSFMWYRHHADADGRLVKVEARVVLDGGAYLSTSTAVTINAASFAPGPYRVPNAVVEAVAARTNNPPCGAMRGFGATQTCFAYEAQMDKLAVALGLDPIELRLRNALKPGDALITGQVLRGAVPVAEVIRTCAAAPLPAGDPTTVTELELPGGTGRTAERGRVRRGVGFAVGIKNLLFSAGFDDCVRGTMPAGGRRRNHHLCRRRGRTGLCHPRSTDHPRGPRSRRRDPGACGHGRHRFGGVDLGEPSDLDVGRGRPSSLPCRPQSTARLGLEQARCRARDARDRRRQGGLAQPGNRPSGL